MMKKNIRICLILGYVFTLIPLLAGEINSDLLIGKWLTEKEDAHIEIYKRDNMYFGKIVWMEKPFDSKTGQLKLDNKNPDEKLRNKARLGLEILKNFIFNEGGKWEDGKIYDPRTGSTYSCYIEYIDENTLKVRGYLGISMLGKNTYWKRINRDMENR